jgi:8-oxo-dGTP pyrophosphatase MutT (NUDIX family)
MMGFERYIVNVEGAIVRTDGRYLMLVRSHQKRHEPGALTFPGGKVEGAGTSDMVLETHLRREIDEETGISVYDDIHYVESRSFVTGDGEAVIDVIFLCRYKSGEPLITRPDEVEAIHWMTMDEIFAHPDCKAWTRQSLALAEALRSRL